MEEDDPTRDNEAKPVRNRRPWETPQLIEYGSVAKLTQSGGSTIKETGVPSKGPSKK
jgi:hypothetical protein